MGALVRQTRGMFNCDRKITTKLIRHTSNNILMRQSWTRKPQKLFIRKNSALRAENLSVFHGQIGKRKERRIEGQGPCRGFKVDCCGASVASEQQRNQDLKRIYKREYKFSNSSLFTRRHCSFLPECIAFN